MMADAALIATTRRLIRRIRSGVLATTLAPGHGHPATPFASLVTVAPAHDLSPLCWLSALAQHSRNLTRDPRCSLLLAGPPQTPNPQTAARATLTGSAARIDDPALLARWHALNPYAGWYSGLQDFSLWRLTIEAVHVVAGFAAASWIDPAALARDPGVESAFAADEAAIVARCSADHAASLPAIAVAAGGSAGTWRLVAADPDGFDLGSGEAVLRIDFQDPVQSPAEFRAALRRLAETIPPG